MFVSFQIFIIAYQHLLDLSDVHGMEIALWIALINGVLNFQTLVDYFGSYAVVEVALLLLVLLPTLAVYAQKKKSDGKCSAILSDSHQRRVLSGLWYR